MSQKLEKWQEGDAAAFEALFREHGKSVYHTAILITGSSDKAQDVLQAVFLSVWKSRTTYNPAKAGMATWIHHITVNECAHSFNTVKTTSTLDDCDLAIPESAEPEAITISHEEFKSLNEELAKIDEMHRAVLVLRYFNDLSYTEIAGILDIPLGTVKSRLNKALMLLKDRVRSKGG